MLITLPFVTNNVQAIYMKVKKARRAGQSLKKIHLVRFYQQILT